MNFAEIQQAVGANPALLTEIAQGFGKDLIPVIAGNDDLVKVVVPTLTQKGFIVRSKADEESFLNTYKNQVVEQEIPSRIKDVHDRYDNDLFELTGERKAGSEKTYDFLKRKITELKTSKIEDPVLKEQLITLQRSLEDKEKTHKKTVEEIENKYFSREVDMIVSAALNNVNIALPAHLKTDEEKQAYVNSQKLMMKRDFISSLTAKKDNDGNIVFFNGDKPITSQTDGKALNSFDIIKERYGFYLAKEDRQQGGAGTGGNGNGQAAFSTKEEVHNYLVNKGVQPGTKPFYDEYAKLIKEHGVTK